MSIARVTLTIGNLSHEQSHALAEVIENDFRLDPLAVTINETDEAQALWETVAWFETTELAEEARALLEHPEAVVADVPDLDWVRRSLEGLSPVRAGRFFLHGSHDRAARRDGGVSLEIDAGTAFGTGHHGTTAGCLEALDDILKRHRPRRILDLGCGTGVLAIAASKALKSPSLATDIDPEAVRVTMNNAALNGAKPLIRGQSAPGLHHASIHRAAPYDLIFANILARPLAFLAQGLSTILAPGGHLILSGLTVDQKRWIIACYQNRGLRHAKTIRHDNWLAIVMVKPHKQKRSKPEGSERFSNAEGLGWYQDA